MLLAAACSAGATPVTVAPPDTGTGPAACLRLHRGLPDELDGRDRRDTRPRSELTAAWGAPPVVMRCGVERPGGLTPGSEVLEVEGVAWFLVERPRVYVFTTVGRTTYVELRVPATTPREQATAPLVDLAPAVTDTLPSTD